MAWEGPPPRYSQLHGRGQGAFWDFIRSMDPNSSGQGVDHVPPPPPPPHFPFGPGAAAGGPWGPWGHGHAGQAGGDYYGPWGGGFGPWGGGRQGSWRRRHRDDNFNHYNSASDDEAEQVAAATADEKDAGHDVDMQGTGYEKEKEKEKQNDREDSPGTMRDSPADGPGAAAAAASGGESGSGGPHRRRGCHGRSRSRHGHGHGHGSDSHGFGGCGRGRGGFGRGGPFGAGRPPHHHGPHGPRGGPPPPFAGAFDLSHLGAVLGAASQHIPQHVREQIARYVALARQYAGGDGAGADPAGADDDVDSFTPPADVFDTGASGPWVVHVALPGAKREDLGVHWDADKGVLAVSGVVYRPGDEAFLSGMVSGERKVGLFRREVTLPPPTSQHQHQQQGGEAAAAAAGHGREEVDPEGITARLEDGVLIVTVPRVEKEWTEIRKVDVM